METRFSNYDDYSEYAELETEEIIQKVYSREISYEKAMEILEASGNNCHKIPPIELAEAIKDFQKDVPILMKRLYYEDTNGTITNQPFVAPIYYGHGDRYISTVLVLEITDNAGVDDIDLLPVSWSNSQEKYIVRGTYALGQEAVQTVLEHGWKNYKTS